MSVSSAFEAITAELRPVPTMSAEHAPTIALENDSVRSALAARDAKAVEFALASEF